MILRKHGDDLDVRNGFDELFDRPAQDRDTAEIQELLRHGSPHPDTASRRHND